MGLAECLRRAPRTLAAALALLGAVTAQGQALYAASMRSFANAGSQIVVGNLFTINMANTSATLIAPIRLEGNTAVGITGMAVHPATGVFYGITSGLSPDHPHSLVKIDPETGDASLIGRLSLPGSDISFDSGGTLYIWLPATRQIGSVNISTGTVTPIGTPGPPTSAGGLAIDPKDNVAYITPQGAAGTLDRVDLKTGAITPGPTLSGAPFPAAINAMTFTPSGLLIAVNSNAGVPQSTFLVGINTSSGIVSPMGTLPDDTDAVTFAGKHGLDPIALLRTISGRVLALIALSIGCVVGLIVYAIWSRRRRRRPAA
jgi:hypothetical protein